MEDIESVDQDQQQVKSDISTEYIAENAPVLTKSILTRLLDLEMRCKASDSKIEELEQRWNSALHIIKQIRPEYEKPWRNLGSGEVVKDPEKGHFQLAKNLYSVLATSSWKSRPFWFSLLIIIGFQFTLLVLLAYYEMDIFNTKSSRSVYNPLNAPPNVEPLVRYAQVLLLVIALFSQGDLLGGVENLSLGRPASYRGAPRFRNLNRWQWRLASIVRVCQGLVYVLCAFILSVKSETVFDVLLNVLGVGFVSDLDDLVFRLGTLGFFGKPMKKLTIEIDQCDFVRKKIEDSGKIARNFKKGLHRIVTYCVLAIVLILFYNLSGEQNQGKYTVQNIYVELNDESISTSFSGHYSREGDTVNRRLVYKQVNPLGSDRGQFMYCFEREDGRGAWVFLIDQNYTLGRTLDPCRDFTFTSDRTITYDILSIEQWYFSLCEDESVNTLTMHESFDCPRPATEENADGTWDDVCPIVQGAGSLPLYKVDIEKDQPRLDSNTMLGHGIYMSRESTVTTGRELLFFVGSTWVTTTEAQLGFNGSDIEEFLELGPDVGLDWVNLITEAVSPNKVGYWPDQEEFYVPSQNQSLVAFADKSRPVGVFKCMDCASLDSSVSCNTGRCNLETGLCNCQHNETGAFCERPPLGNGICDDLFNEASSGFDDGDCCGSTCTQPHCGIGGLKTLFGWDIESLYYTNISTEEIVGFQKCKDTEMNAVVLDLVPLPKVADLCVPAFTIQCGEPSVLFLRTPLFCRTDLSGLQQEKIMVPSGATCSISIANANLTNGIDRIQLMQESGGDSGTSNLPIEVPVFDEVLEWSVP